MEDFSALLLLVFWGNLNGWESVCVFLLWCIEVLVE